MAFTTRPITQVTVATRTLIALPLIIQTLAIGAVPIDPVPEGAIIGIIKTALLVR
jgi:hypothetical protein